MHKLAPGGRFILHTGVSIVDGRDVLLDALRERLPAIGWPGTIDLLDPDIFSEELDRARLCRGRADRRDRADRGARARDG